MDLYEDALRLVEAGGRFALAMVIHSSGSTPQKPGAKAIFEARGAVIGTLGGGCLEAESRARALRALDDGAPLAFDLKLDEVNGWDDGLVCGGTVRIFVTPDARVGAKAYRAMLEAWKGERRGVLLTVISHPAHPAGTAFWAEEGKLDALDLALDSASLAKILKQEKPGRILVEGDEDTQAMEVFVEPVFPRPKLIIAGAGHIGKATARLGARLGFQVTIIDDRPSFANAKHVPDADTILCGDIAKEIAGLSIDKNTYVVVVTRGHRHDAQALAACIHAPAAYIGLIGSRRKSLLLKKRLVEDGHASEEEVRRVASPIGVDIGAESVEEIALSIAAQLVAVRRNHDLGASALTLEQ